MRRPPLASVHAAPLGLHVSPLSPASPLSTATESHRGLGDCEGGEGAPPTGQFPGQRYQQQRDRGHGAAQTVGPAPEPDASAGASPLRFGGQVTVRGAAVVGGGLGGEHQPPEKVAAMVSLNFVSSLPAPPLRASPNQNPILPPH